MKVVSFLKEVLVKKDTSWKGEGQKKTQAKNEMGIGYWISLCSQKKINNSCARHGQGRKEEIDNRKRVIYSCGAQLSGIADKTTCMQASG